MIASLGLSPSHAALLEQLLAEHLPGVTVWAYGLRVKGSAQPNSDLDLVALAPPGLKRRVSELREALEESNLPCIVDLHVWDELPASFQDNIHAGHLVVRDASPN